MPFLALAAPAIAGAFGVTGALGTAAIGAGLGAAGTLAQNKLMTGSASGSSGYTPSQVNIDQLNAQTKSIAEQNALDAAALEQRLTPEVPGLRSSANRAVAAGVAPTGAENQSLMTLLAGMPGGSGDTVLQRAIAKAKSDLALGGQLGQDQQNLVTRNALSNAGGVAGPGGGLGLGRDMVARDLGLTSLGLEQQRLATALGAGGQESSDTMNRVNLINQLKQAQFGRALGAAQYGESIRQPMVGLDPSAAANIAVGNMNANNAALANQAAIRGQSNQGMLNMGGQLLGYGLLNMNNNPYSYDPMSGNRTAVGKGGAPVGSGFTSVLSGLR